MTTSNMDFHMPATVDLGIMDTLQTIRAHVQFLATVNHCFGSEPAGRTVSPVTGFMDVGR
jgi:hypothetical protein